MLRIFGRTTLVSQFMVRSEQRSSRSRLKYMAARTGPGKLPPRGCKRLSPRQLGLFCGLFGAPHALRQRGDEIGHRVNRFRGGAAFAIEAAAEGIDQRGADHRTISALGDVAGGFRGADAEAD